MRADPEASQASGSMIIHRGSLARVSVWGALLIWTGVRPIGDQSAGLELFQPGSR